MGGKIAVIGVADRPVLDDYCSICSEMGFDVKWTRKKPELMGLLELPACLYIVEIHIGCKGAWNDGITGFTAYSVIKERVDSEKAGFAGISSNHSSLQRAADLGVPREYLHLKPWNPADFLQKWI